MKYMVGNMWRVAAGGRRTEATREPHKLEPGTPDGALTRFRHRHGGRLADAPRQMEHSRLFSKRPAAGVSGLEVSWSQVF